MAQVPYRRAHCHRRLYRGSELYDLVAAKYGEYICQFDYKKTSGLIGESNKKRHFDFLPFEDWNPEEDFNKEFGYKHYTEFYRF